MNNITIKEILESLNEATATLKGVRFGSSTEFHSMVRAKADEVLSNLGIRHMLDSTTWSFSFTSDTDRQSVFWYWDSGGYIPDKRCKNEIRGRFGEIKFRIFDEVCQHRLNLSGIITEDMTITEAESAVHRALIQRKIRQAESNIQSLQADIRRDEAFIKAQNEKLQLYAAK